MCRVASVAAVCRVASVAAVCRVASVVAVCRVASELLTRTGALRGSGGAESLRSPAGPSGGATPSPSPTPRSCLTGSATTESLRRLSLCDDWVFARRIVLSSRADFCLVLSRCQSSRTCAQSLWTLALPLLRAAVLAAFSSVAAVCVRCSGISLG